MQRFKQHNYCRFFPPGYKWSPVNSLNDQEPKPDRGRSNVRGKYGIGPSEPKEAVNKRKGRGKVEENCVYIRTHGSGAFKNAIGSKPKFEKTL